MEMIKTKRKVKLFLPPNPPYKGGLTEQRVTKRTALLLPLFKVFWLLILFLNVQFLQLSAQTQAINLSLKNISLHKILMEIKKQSGKNIVYNNNLIEKYTNETIEVNNETLEAALNKILERKNLNYKIIDNVIIIEPNKENTFSNSLIDLHQTIKGTIFDIESDNPLIGANIILQGTEPVKGTISDENGNFKIENVQIGRYNLSISYTGYASYNAREVLVGSGKEVVLNVGLKESVTQLAEVKIKSVSNKERPINSMATLSARQFSVEEANRYAGGIDDPSRLVSSYAGVTSSSLMSDGIVIRGNAPKGLLWRMEGVDIPCPIHFTEYAGAGSGLITGLSSQTMANSDFYTGAFPAEYGNALSGVFDINLRTGNTEKREYTFQAGIVGIDFAAEGPFVKDKNSSYLFNYRYSTSGLVTKLMPKDLNLEVTDFQDLSFKTNFVTKSSGTFTIWGIGLYSHLYKPEANLVQMSNTMHRDFKFSMGAFGITHKKIINAKMFLQTTFAPSGRSISWTEGYTNENYTYVGDRETIDKNWKYTIKSFINYKFNARHTNRTGFSLEKLSYSIDNKNRQVLGGSIGNVMPTVNLGDGRSYLYQFFSQSKLSLTDNLIVNAGLHSQYFALNKKYTLEPRLGIRWNFLQRQSISFAYGLHSQLENLNIYTAVNLQNQNINKYLDFNKAHHFVIGYDLKISENVVFKVEPYYQRLFNIPVTLHSSYSTINLLDNYNINDTLVNKGTGRNIGVDFTLERFLNKGYYYLITASIFDSKYKGGDGIERNTRYNKNYVFNLVAGKEWFTGDIKNKVIGANVRFTFMGGNWIDALNMNETMLQQQIVFDRTKAFSKKLPDAPILSLSMNYRKNKPNYSSIWTIQIINALGYREFSEYTFNNNKVEEIKDLMIIPMLSYKIEF
jgi:hypothetical protein